MSRYFLSKSLPDNIADFQPNDDVPPLSSSSLTFRTGGGTRYVYGNPTASAVASVRPLQQSRRINQNNQDQQNNQSLTWNISLTDDQDEVSERFLRMRDGPTTAAVEKFGPAISMVPEYVRKQADELFRPTDIHPNEIFDTVNNTRASWILPSGYQQYIQSIPQNVLEKRERHVLYPWTQWNTSTGAHHRPAPNGIIGSSSASDRSSSSSSSSSLYAHPSFVRSPERRNSNLSIYGNTSSYGNTSGYGNMSGYGNSSDYGNMSSYSNMSGYGNNMSGYGSGVASTAATDSSSASDITSNYPSVVWTAREQQSSPYSTPPRYACSTPTVSTTTTTTTAATTITPTDTAAINSEGATATPIHSPSRLYYCVNTDTNTINKLVEHYCTFCYKNHEPPEVYGSHLLRDSVRTTCPKLRALKCKHCNGTGDNAHTIKYCPFVYANYK